MSEGEWIEMRPEKDSTHDSSDTDESTDTYDTIEWLLKNVPHNNGKVGLYGGSYSGFYTSTGLINAHPALVAASPQAPIANFSFYTTFTKQDNPELDQDPGAFYGTRDGYQFYLRMGSLINSEKFFAYKNPYWTDVIKHTNYDEFWKSRDILPHLKNIHPAVLVVGGWFDAEDLLGTLKTYRVIEAQSPGTVNKLVMGPRGAGGWIRSTGERLGAISFDAKTSEFFVNEMELPFFRHYLKGSPDPNLPAAYVFETGKNNWQRKQQWPPANLCSERLYLHADNQLTHDKPRDLSGLDEYVSDPNKPVPSFNRATLEMDPDYMDADQRFVEKRSDALSYETDPLSSDTTIAGPISPLLFVFSTATDSDFVVKLIDVYPSNRKEARGYEQLVRGEPFRGKFRNGFGRPEPFRRDETEQIRFSMPDVYHCFRKGHRMMVEIQSSWFRLVDRNPQTFTHIPFAKSEQFVKATERIYRSNAAASFVEINVEQ